MNTAVIALAVALVLVVVVCAKWIANVRGQLDSAQTDVDDLWEAVENKEKYIHELEMEIVDELGPDGIARALNRLFSPVADADDEEVSAESDADGSDD